MSDSYIQLLHSDPLYASAVAALAFVFYLLLGVLPICAVSYLAYWLLTLPLRRNERARIFLDLLELGMREGRTPEAAVTDAAATRDRSLGVRFHLLAAHIEGGLRLSQALERVPRLVPPQVGAMLSTGERIGDIRKVLPACRLLLRDSVSQVRSALNYVILLAFAISPAVVAMPVILRLCIFPKFEDVFAGMLEGRSLPAFTRLVFGGSTLIMVIQLCIIGFIWLLTIVTSAGRACMTGSAASCPASRIGCLPACPGAATAFSETSRPCSPCCWMPRYRKAKPSASPLNPLPTSPSSTVRREFAPCCKRESNCPKPCAPWTTRRSCSGGSQTPCAAAPVLCAP